MLRFLKLVKAIQKEEKLKQGSVLPLLLIVWTNNKIHKWKLNLHYTGVYI